MPRTVVVLQPGYLPWLGFFDQLHRADVFVYYDDVQFDKHGWRNRNRVKAPTGEPQWLTVPVRHKGLDWPCILDVEIDNRAPWARKHLGTLRHFYARAPHLGRYVPELEKLLTRGWDRLVDLDIAVVELVSSWLGFERSMLRASELGIGGDQSERLLAICRHLGANRYLTGDSARDYLDTGLFERHGVEVVWQHYEHPVYPQQHGPFVPYLSVIDLILNCGDASLGILAGSAPPAP